MDDSQQISEAMLLDFNGYLGSAEPDTRDGIQKVLDISPDPEAMKRQIASQYAVAAHSKGAYDLRTIQDNWPQFRAGYAEARGGDFLTAKFDDDAFYEQLAKDAQKTKDERGLLEGLDGTPVKPGAAARFGAWLMPRSLGVPPSVLDFEQDTARRKTAYDESLRNRAEQAAFDGKTAADALSEWQTGARSKPGYDEARANDYASFAAERYKDVADTIERVKPLADQAYELMAKGRGVMEGEGDIAPAEVFRGLTPQEKRTAFELMKRRAGNGPDKGDWTGFAQATGEAFGRGFENLAFGSSAGEMRSFLLHHQFAAGDVVNEPDAKQELLRQFTQDYTAQRSDNPEGAALAKSLLPSKTGHALTAEEADAWNQKAGVMADDLDTFEQLRKFGQGVIDPTDKSGGVFRRKFFLPAMDSAALMTSLAVPGATSGALALGARSYQNEEYLRLREDFPEMDKRQADRLALVTGAAQSALDKLEFGVLGHGLGYLGEVASKVPGFNKIPLRQIAGVENTARTLEQFAMGGNPIARFAANTAGTATAETVIELAQDHVVPALVQDNLTSDPRFDVNWADVWLDTVKAAPETFAGMVLLSGIGGIEQVRAQSKFVQDLSESAAAMRLRGYTMDQIREIQAAPMGDRGALLAQFLPEKAPEGAERETLKTEALQLFREEQAKAAARARVEGTLQDDAAGMGVQVTRSSSGWWVTDSKRSVQVSSAEAARSLTEDLLQAATQEEAAAMVATADNWHATTPEGVTRETTFTGEIAHGAEDGKSVTYTRPTTGETRTVELSGKSLANYRAEALMDAEADGNGDVGRLVFGRNEVEFREQLADDAKQLVQRLEINIDDQSSALTLLHERAEVMWRTGMANGTFTREGTERAIAHIADAFDPARARDDGQRALYERVQRVARGEANDAELRETVSELAVANAIGRRKDSGALPAGSVTKAVDAMLSRLSDPQDVKTMSRFRAALRAVRQHVRALFGAVAALKKARREGSSEHFDALTDKLFGLDEQRAFDHSAAEEAKAVAMDAAGALDYTPPSAEDEANGIAFKLGRTNLPRLGQWATLERQSFAEQMKHEEQGGARWQWFKQQSERTDAPNEDQQTRAWAESVHDRFGDVAEIRALKPDELIDLGEIIPEAAVTLTKAEGERLTKLLNVADDHTPEQAAELAQLMRTVKAGLTAGWRRWDVISETEDGGSTFSLRPSTPERDARMLRALEVSGEALKGGLPEMRRAVREFIAEHLQGRTLTNRDTAQEIGFSSESKKQSVGKLNKEPHFRSAMQLAAIVEDAILLGDVAPKKGREKNTEAFSYYAMPIVIDGREAVAWFNTRNAIRTQAAEAAAGGNFYEFGVYQDKAARTLQNARGALSSEARQIASTSGPNETVGAFLARVKDTLPAAIRVQEGGTYRLAPASRLEAVQRSIEANLAGNPEARIRAQQRAIQAVQKFATDWSSERMTARGDAIRPVVEKRTTRELDKEQAMREVLRAQQLTEAGMANLSRNALAALNAGAQRLDERPLVHAMLADHGKLISKSRAAREGRVSEYDGAPAWLPPSWYAPEGRGGLMPDEMAQMLYDAGMIAEPSPDVLWQALDAEVRSVRGQNAAFGSALDAVRDIERQARNTAKEETYEWRREEDAKQKKDWSFQSGLVRDLRTLEAVSSVFPAEVRAQIGGAVNLARLATPEARLREMQRRVARAGVLYEANLRKELRTAIDGLFEKAAPKMGENRVQTSTLGPEAQELTAKAQAASLLDENATAKELAGLEAQMAAPDLDAKQLAETAERWGIINQFGNLGERTAAELSTAHDWLRTVMAEGRSQWRMKEEARLEEVRQQREAIIGTLGKATPGQLSKRDQKDKSLTAKFDAYATSHYAFHQILRDVLGKDHPIVKKLTSLVRHATAGHERDMNAAQAHFREAMAAALGYPSFTFGARLKLDRELDRLRKPVENAVELVAGRATKTERVPIALAEKIIAGEAEGLGGTGRENGTMAFGPTEGSASSAKFTEEEKQALQAALDALPADSRKGSVEIERVLNEGAKETMTLSPLEAMQFLLSWGQPDVRARMERQGYTEKSIEQMHAMVAGDFAQAVMGYLRQEYAAGYDRLNPTYQRMFGMSMPRVENYAPTSYRTGKETGGEASPFGVAPDASGMSAGFVKSRVNHDLLLRKTDALMAFFQHTTQALYWRNFAELTRELRGVLGNADVSNAMAQGAGKAKADQVGRWIDTLARGGGNRAQELAEINALMSRMVSGKAVAAMGLSIRTVLMQADAALRFMLKLPFSAQAAGLARLFTGRLSASISDVWKSDTIQRRLESGYTPEVRLIMQQNNVRPSILLHAAEKAMVPMQLADAALTTVSSAIVFDYHYREALATGLSKESATALAADAMDEAVFETAQPASVAQRSLMEAGAGTTPLIKAYMLFRSDNRLKFSLEYEALKGLFGGKGMTKGEAVRTLVATRLYALLGQFLGDLFKDGFSGDDDDEIWKWENYVRALTLGHINGLFLVGDGVTWAANWALGVRNFGSSQNLLEQSFHDLQQATTHPEKLTDLDDPEAMVKSWRNVARASSIAGQKVGSAAAGLNFLTEIFGLLSNAQKDE